MKKTSHFKLMIFILIHHEKGLVRRASLDRIVHTINIDVPVKGTGYFWEEILRL